MKNVPIIVWIAATAVTLALISAFVILIVQGKSPDALTALLTDKLPVAISAFAALYVTVKTRSIEKQTNGTTTALTSLVAVQSGQLATSVPAPVVEPLVATVAAKPAVVTPTDTPAATSSDPLGPLVF